MAGALDGIDSDLPVGHRRVWLAHRADRHASSAVSSFENDILAFEYPANWNALVPESGDRALVLLSTEPLATTEPRVTALGDDGVYIAFGEAAAAPLPTPDPSFSTEVEVGGRPAIVTRSEADGDCASIGGEQLLLVSFDSPRSSPDVRLAGLRARTELRADQRRDRRDAGQRPVEELSGGRRLDDRELDLSDRALHD